MSIVDEVATAPESMLAISAERLEQANRSVTYWSDRAVEAERKIDNVQGYLMDCIDMGDSPDADSIADLLGLELEREYSVSVDLTFQFTIKTTSESEAQSIADSIYFHADGDYESDEYEVTNIDVNEA